MNNDYTKPVILDYGDVAEVTEAAVNGTRLDAALPAGAVATFQLS